MLTLHDRVALQPDALVQEIGGDVVIINPVSAEFLVLNASGAFLLERTQPNALLRQLAADLAEHYDLPSSQAEGDVLAWAQEMVGARVLAVVSPVS